MIDGAKEEIEKFQNNSTNEHFFNENATRESSEMIDEKKRIYVTSLELLLLRSLNVLDIIAMFHLHLILDETHDNDVECSTQLRDDDKNEKTNEEKERKANDLTSCHRRHVSYM